MIVAELEYAVIADIDLCADPALNGGDGSA